MELILKKEEFQLNGHYVFLDNEESPEIVKLIRKDNPHAQVRDNEHVFENVDNKKLKYYESLDYIERRCQFFPITKGNIGYIISYYKFKNKKSFINKLVSFFIKEFAN